MKIDWNASGLIGVVAVAVFVLLGLANLVIYLWWLWRDGRPSNAARQYAESLHSGRKQLRKVDDLQGGLLRNSEKKKCKSCAKYKRATCPRVPSPLDNACVEYTKRK